MPLHRLVHLIESHSQELASELLNRVHQSPHLTSFSKVPDHELRQRVHEIYSHLGQWLMSRTEGEIARQYAEIGARLRASRARRGGFRFHRELAPSSVSKARMLRSSDDLPSAGPSFLYAALVLVVAHIPPPQARQLYSHSAAAYTAYHAVSCLAVTAPGLSTTSEPVELACMN